MLRIKSNYNNFKDRQNDIYTDEDLTVFYNNLVKPDIINLHGNMSYGFTSKIAAEIINKLTIDSFAKILVINDLSLHMLNTLLKSGYKKENIYLAYGKWNKNATLAEDTYVYELMKEFVKANIKDKLNIIELKEIFNMKYKVNAIIANPPYGKIGANITKKIIDNIDFDEYINLLPANDYKRNDSKDLFNYQSDMISIKDGFADAAVTTHLARIHGNKVNDMTLDEFERSNYIDRSLDKYFAKQYSRETAYTYTTNTPIEKIQTISIDKTVILGAKDVNHHHLPYSKKCVQYRWNVTADVDANWVKENYSCVSSKKDKQTSLFVIYLISAIEKTNIVNFLYSLNGFRFLQKLWKSINVDSYCMPDKWLPKVDWTRSWTVEEILADYGYTESEIKEVMNDLVNYKSMED